MLQFSAATRRPIMARGQQKVYIRRARSSDCAELELNPRRSDVREVAALVGALRYEDAARFALASSDAAWTVFVGIKIVCMYGVGRECALTGGRQPWLLGTPMVDMHWRRFAFQSRAILTRLVEEYGPLENVVDARNRMTIRWLKFLGFTLYGAEPYGREGLPFHRFRIE